MYSALFRKLPGGKFAKTVQLVLLAMIVVSILFFLVFPAVDALISEDPSINA
jgi:hypothetical protein